TLSARPPPAPVVPRPPVAPAIGQPPMQPGLPAATVVETVTDTVDAITTRGVARRAEPPRAARPLVTRQVSARPEPRVMRNKAVRKMATTRVAARPVARI